MRLRQRWIELQRALRVCARAGRDLSVAEAPVEEREVDVRKAGIRRREAGVARHRLFEIAHGFAQVPLAAPIREVAPAQVKIESRWVCRAPLGKGTHPLYEWLKSQKGGLAGSRIKWNFTKFLVGKDGQPVKRYGSATTPKAIAGDIKQELNK